jgi:DNA-binding SARP family transcriptional activator
MGAEFRLFGGFDVVIDGVPIADGAWTRRHAAALVKLLALAPDRRLLRDRVIDALWPDLLVDEAAPRLHKAAHFARTAMGARGAVVLAGETVSLLPDTQVFVDVDEFDSLSEKALTGSGDVSAAQRAVELYRGELLPDDLYEPWAEQPREIRRMRYGQLLRELHMWGRLVELDPVDEEAHLHLVQQHLDRGDGRAALHQLDVLEEAVHTELGVGPSPAAREMRERARTLPGPGHR